MSTRFAGRLFGSLNDVSHPLADARVRVYRLQGDAPPRDPAEPLGPEAVEGKEKLLIAEADLDERGGFSLDLGDHQAMELDVRMAAPGQKEARQFTLTRLDAASIRGGSLEHAISPEVWKALIFPRRMIYGRITACGTTQGMAGLKVSAFDDDWIHDDALGSDTTDAGGNYVIYYTSAQYRQTLLSPLINVDTPLGGDAGPEVYFRISGPAGPLLNEPSSRGEAADRRNAPPVFLVNLCVTGEVVDPPVVVAVEPMFLRVGDYQVNTVHGDFAPTGVTGHGEGFAFTGHVPLEGNLPDATAPTAMEYRFLAREYADSDGSGPLGAEIELDETRLEQARIGWLVYYDYDSVNDSYVPESTPYYAGGAPAQVNVRRSAAHGGDILVDVTTPIKAGGWIEVPRINEYVVGGRGRFEAALGAMATLRTDTLTRQTIDLTSAPAHEAGKPVPADKRAAPRVFQISFQAGPVGGAVTLTNVLERISMINATFLYDVHPNWSGHAGDARAVVSVNVKEVIDGGGGCGKVNNLVNVLYTIYHPFFSSPKISFEGPDPMMPGSNLVIGPDGHASSPDPIPITPPFDPAIEDDHCFDFTANPNCAYIVRLGATLDLTSGRRGRILSPGVGDHIAFCKG
jgi:hypothetical protein